jgi:hypothetical protein
VFLSVVCLGIVHSRLECKICMLDMSSTFGIQICSSLQNVAHFDEISGALNQISELQVHLKSSGVHLKL